MTSVTQRSALGRHRSLSTAQRQLWTLGVAVVALAGSVAVYRQVWVDPFSRSLGSPGQMNDPIQTMWNLKWVASSLVHLRNPFATDAIYYPSGVSLSWNTLTPSLGVLAAPVTLTAGPVFAYAMLITLGPALAAVTGFLWLRRHTSHLLAAAAGGLVVGFNPFMSGHMLGHLDLTFTALVPVMLMLCEDLLWRRPRPARTTAVYLGLVTAVQAGISEELILITAVAVALALGAALIVERTAVRDAVSAAAPAFGTAIAVFLVAASPLLVSQLLLSSPVRLNSSAWSARLNDYLVPLGRQLFNPGIRHYSRLGAAEDGVYLGPALLVVLVVGICMTWARDRMLRVAALTLAALVVLTFGDGGPWRFVSRLPVLTSILPGRFSFASFLVIAWIVSRWLDGLLVRLRGPAVPVTVLSALAIAVLLASLGPLVPNEVTAAAVPRPVAFFSSPREGALVPPDAAVLLLPSATPFDATGMYYQMVSDFRFDQPGGYALRPSGRSVAAGPPGSSLVQVCALAGSGHDVPARDVTAARQQLVAEHYRAIVVIDSAQQSRLLDDLARRLAGHAVSARTGGVSIWLLGA